MRLLKKKKKGSKDFKSRLIFNCKVKAGNKKVGKTTDKCMKKN